MSLRSQFATDKTKETQGVRVEYGANEDGTVPAIILCRMGKSNRAYTKALELASRPHRRQLELGTLSNDVAERLALEVFASTVVKGWENVQEDDGTSIPFNRDNVIRMLTELPDLYDDLQSKAGGAALFRESAREDEAKN